MIGQKFFVKIDKKAIHFPADVASLEEAVGLSLAYSYILDTKYPEALKFVYLFFEHLFRFENFFMCPTRTVQSLFSKVWPSK